MSEETMPPAVMPTGDGLSGAEQDTVASNLSTIAGEAFMSTSEVTAVAQGTGMSDAEKQKRKLLRLIIQILEMLGLLS